MTLRHGWRLDNPLQWCQVTNDALMVERATIQGAGKVEALCVAGVADPTHLLTATVVVTPLLRTSWCWGGRAVLGAYTSCPFSGSCTSTGICDKEAKLLLKMVGGLSKSLKVSLSLPQVWIYTAHHHFLTGWWLESLNSPTLLVRLLINIVCYSTMRQLPFLKASVLLSLHKVQWNGVQDLRAC